MNDKSHKANVSSKDDKVAYRQSRRSRRTTRGSVQRAAAQVVFTADGENSNYDNDDNDDDKEAMVKHKNDPTTNSDVAMKRSKMRASSQSTTSKDENMSIVNRRISNKVAKMDTQIGNNSPVTHEQDNHGNSNTSPPPNNTTTSTIDASLQTPGAVAIRPTWRQHSMEDSESDVDDFDDSSGDNRNDDNDMENVHSTTTPEPNFVRNVTNFSTTTTVDIENSIQAERIDPEAEQERIKETLQHVLQSHHQSTAVQVVDVEAEHRLKVQRQKRAHCLYVVVAMILSAVVVTAVVISVKNAKQTSPILTPPPTELPSMSPTMAPTSRLLAVQSAIEEEFGPIQTTAQELAIDWITHVDQLTTFPLDGGNTNAGGDHDLVEQFYDRYAVVVFAFATNYEHWLDNTHWLNGTLSVCDWHGLTCNDDDRVVIVDLARHNLTGTIPSEMGQLKELRILFLFQNALVGTLPTELGNLGEVESFYLNENQLTGSIPDEMSGMFGVDELYLFDNQLNGTIPSTLGTLIEMTKLYLFGNQLSGQIPSGLQQLKRIDQLFFHNNSLSGEIPSELGTMLSLERITLHSNALTGTIPSTLGALPTMTVLTFQDNNLSGTMPSEICNLRTGSFLTFLEILAADCLEKVNCTCCTLCS